jgi:Fic family protein
MKPPYDITPLILNLVSAISEKIGIINARLLSRPSPQLRKQNRIKTIHSSLRIEGNTLSEEQITALLENKRVIGPEKDVLEVLNAIKVYENLQAFRFTSEKSFLKAHAQLMNGLVGNAGKYRNKSVGIVKGSDLEHLAPPHENVPFLMKDLFRYLKQEDESSLIKGCVFHYELEFIHPFTDGNGRMGRLWQTLILMEAYPVFEFLPFETLISQTQTEYYKSLSVCDKTGKSTPFIEYMLRVIDQALAKLLGIRQILQDTARLEYFFGLGITEFSRKDYMEVFRNLSSATASRDLKKGMELGWLESTGRMNKTRYRVSKTQRK